MSINSIRFPSLLNPDKYGYVLEKDFDAFWDQVRRHPIRFIGFRCGVFETLGDGFVQHSPAVAAGSDKFVDYCFSLASYLMDNQEYFEFAYNALYNPFKPYSRMRDYVNFFGSMRYDENKPHRYYSTDGDFYLKVSSSSSKSHDKRWSVIPSNADGKASFVWSMICVHDPSVVSDCLSCYAAYSQFRNLCQQGDVWCPETPGSYLELSYSDHGMIDSSFCALRNVIEAAERLHYANKSLTHLKEAIENGSVSASS